MRLLLALVLVSIAAPASAQFEVSSVTDPIRPDRAPLALAEEVPSVFLLGLGGATATFVNPARAARMDRRFVYGTIRQQGGPGAPVSFAGLFGSRERRWLVTAENRVFTRETTAEQTDRQTFETPFDDVTDTVDNVRTIGNSDTFTSTRARILLVGRTDFGGYAFGLYGGYRANNDEVLIDERLFQETINGTPPQTFTQTRTQTRDTQRLSDRDVLGVGVEVAFAGRTWDLAAAVSYQRQVGEVSVVDASSFNQENVSVFNGSEDISRTTQVRQVAQAIDGTPSAVDFELVAALRAGASRDDYLFGSVSGTFGDGTADYAFDSSNDFSSVREVNGEVVFEDMQSDAFEDAGEAALSTSATQASLGYVYARRTGRRKGGMTILAAINPRGGFGRTDAVTANPNSNALTLRRETERTMLALELPLFVRFGVTDRLDAFGGGTYTYAYAREETVTRPLTPEGSLPEGQTVETTSERTSDSFDSNSRLYAGAVFTFRSGLSAQASLRGNLAELNRWTVSLGYHF